MPDSETTPDATPETTPGPTPEDEGNGQGAEFEALGEVLARHNVESSATTSAGRKKALTAAGIDWRAELNGDETPSGAPTPRTPDSEFIDVVVPEKYGTVWVRDETNKETAYPGGAKCRMSREQAEAIGATPA